MQASGQEPHSDTGSNTDSDSSNPGAAESSKRRKLDTNYDHLLTKDIDYDAAPNFEPMKCSICLEKIQIFSGVVLRECSHGFCRDCLKITINSSDQSLVMCPFQDDKYKCTKVLQPREVRALCTEKEYKNCKMKPNLYIQPTTSVTNPISTSVSDILTIALSSNEHESSDSSQTSNEPDLQDFDDYMFGGINEFEMPLSTSIVSTPLYNWRTMELNMRKEKLLNSPIYTLPTGSKCDEPSFKIIELVPKNHHYNTMIPFKFQSSFMNVLHKEFILLTNDLPPGIFVRSFEDRVDLLCAMIEGPKNTPYENGLFFFDIKLPANYPLSPPQFFFISYSPTVIKNYSTSYDRLNPNLYQKGKVCVSLLGTWKGSESENWTRKCTLLQVLVSIQGLILVNEPFYNEPGYESQKDTPFGRESSRKYNEMVLLRVVESVNNILTNPPEVFQREILIHFQKIGKAYFSKMLNLMDLTYNVPASSALEFTLLPLQQHFFKPMLDRLDTLSTALVKVLTAELEAVL